MVISHSLGDTVLMVCLSELYYILVLIGCWGVFGEVAPVSSSLAESGSLQSFGNFDGTWKLI